MLDREFLVAQMKSEIAYIHRHWRQMGRPTMTLLLTRTIMETGREALLELIEEMRLGECGGVHVRLGRIGELRQTAGKERIDYLHDFAFSEEPVKDARPERYRLSADPVLARPLERTVQLQIERETDAARLTARLAESRNLYEHAEVLQALVSLRGLDFFVSLENAQDDVTVQELLDDVYAQAARGAGGRPYWGVLRRSAGLCDKNDLALSDAVTDILVRQKQITVGKSYSDASLISRPLPPSEIRAKIREFAGPDVREWMLTQEILIFLGLLIRAEPRLFAEQMTLRVGYLILLMTSELADELQIRQEDAYESLMELGPSEIRRRLRAVLGAYDQKENLVRRQESLPLQQGIVQPVEPAPSSGEHCPPGGWLRFRNRQGALNRVPAGFYPSVWNLLSHCKGLIIGDKLDRRNRMDSALILSEMTAGEKNFALWIEQLLNKMDASKYRQINIETLMALADLVKRAPDLVFDDYLVLDVIIGHAVRLAWLNAHPERAGCYEEDKAAAWQAFYESAPNACAAYVVGALHFLTNG
jgi:phosphorylase kinase alpha/beta subunit